MPKEMLPVVDKPAIQYVVEEAVAAGIRDVLIIVGRNKSAIDNHFDSVPELERALENKGDVVKLDAVSRASQLADIHLTRQGEPRGLGHAVGRAESYVGDSPFVVMLGDDLIDARRYDTGDRVDYIKAILQLAVDRDDLGPSLRPWLKDFAADLAPQEALLAR